MKKPIILCFALLVGFAGIKAQPFDESTQTLSVGMGLGSRNYVGNSLLVPPIIVSYEHAILPKIGIGYFSLGAIGSFGAYSTNKYSYFTTNIGARGIYHFDLLGITGASIFEQLDLYAGVVAGARIVTSSDANPPNADPFLHDAFAGARYFFKPNVAVSAEAGYGISWLSIGFNFKF
jgi:hypothetical protein